MRVKRWRIDKWYVIWYTKRKFRKDHYAYDDGYRVVKVLRMLTHCE